MITAGFGGSRTTNLKKDAIMYFEDDEQEERQRPEDEKKIGEGAGEGTTDDSSE